jgi:hypothetical protein
MSRLQVGVIFFSPNDFPAVLSVHKSGEEPPPPPQPRWYPILTEQKGKYVKLAGELLISAQLIPKEGGAQIPVPPLTIETVPAYVEITALGCRDMKPFAFRPMASPFVTFEVQTPKGLETASTNPSKLPNPSNPNFNQVSTSA